jgi:hypothetical protein
MSDNVRLPPRPPPGPPPTQTQKAQQNAGSQAAAKNNKMARKKMEDPQAAANLSADSFSGAISGSSQIRGKVLPPITATVMFTTNPDPAVVGEVRQGGQLVVKYDPARATLKDPAPGGWGVTGTIRFEPGGERFDRPMMEFEFRNGQPSGTVRAGTFTLKVPITATVVVFSFRNWTSHGPVKEWLDDKGGENFRLGVQPPAKQPTTET